MNKYEIVLNYLFNQFPQYQKQGIKAYKANLNNIHQLLDLLSKPHEELKCIHVAGTNGKGSVSHLLASVFQQAGYKTGIFSSPHLVDFRERIKINGHLISKKDVISFVNNNKDSFQSIKPSFFEWTTALAFYYFNKNKTDINIIETGLGGRLDSTNVINPILSIITTISYDHQNILGSTLNEIAKEKAGIIKKKVPVILGKQIKEEKIEIKKIADKKHAKLFIAKNTDAKSSLAGSYQKYNIQIVSTAFDILKEEYNLTKKHLNKGLMNVSNNTNLKGRWEIIKEEPLVICDIGHNFQAMKFIVNQLQELSHRNGIFIFGVSNDKDIEDIIKILPKNIKYFLTQANNPRAMKLNTLYKQMDSFSNKTKFKNPEQAYKTAIEISKKDDYIFIGGSAFIVADILKNI